MAFAAQDVVDAHLDEMTGVALCSNYDGIAVFLKNRTKEIEQELSKITQKYSGYSLQIRQVPEASSALSTAALAIASDPALKDRVRGVGPDIYTGTVEVEVFVPDNTDLSPINPASRSAAINTPAVQAVVTASESQALAKTGRAVGVFASPISMPKSGDNYTRLVDSPSGYHMGAEIVSNTGSVCSTGIPLNVHGTWTVLTAGHCGGSSFYNNGNLVGSQWTTAYPGNAPIYGDWKLLSGQTYLTRVFNGPRSTIPTSNSTLVMSGARYGAIPVGIAMCTSGRTTGQWCTYTVKASGVSVTISGVTSGHQMRMKAVGGHAGGGDSGGPCYHSDGSGGVTATGIVKGWTEDLVNGVLDYCTQVSGVRAWAPTAYLG